jgi:hypothetical protein
MRAWTLNDEAYPAALKYEAKFISNLSLWQHHGGGAPYGSAQSGTHRFQEALG